MGWFDGASESGRSHSSRHHSSTHSHPGKKHHSTSRSTHHKNSSGLRGSVLGSTSPKSSHSHRERSRSRTRGSGSIFGSGDAKHNSSRGSFFGFNSRSTSHYKRSPRPNYLKSIYQKLRQLLRDLIYYMKRHPVKVFMLVIMPLITGGALAALLKKFGVRLPRGLEKLIGGGNGRGGGNETYEFERSSVRSSGDQRRTFPCAPSFMIRWLLKPIHLHSVYLELANYHPLSNPSASSHITSMNRKPGSLHCHRINRIPHPLSLKRQPSTEPSLVNPSTQNISIALN
ncbi:hypothetical protein EYC80_005825 [Monilinia laxa]|uniref:Uncharacterized protein n=1 Tax=Monilinia laxa TaxID=61186 RepID=A0A5N6KFF0_MONLA|nr:hypothetical protein EYC80_005825 [Monilinia laxa]